MWPHGKEKLDAFFLHLNDQSRSIKFTMEYEVDGSLPFLDVLISRKDDGTFSHQVFRKKTHTEQYLHASSHHFHAQKLGVLNTLATRALRISDQSHIEGEKSHMLSVFCKNGYSRSQGLKAFLKAEKSPLIKNNKDPSHWSSSMRLPFIQGTTDKIARALRKHKVSSSFKPLNTIHRSLKSFKDMIDPRDGKGVYIIPCSCGTPYIGKIGW